MPASASAFRHKAETLLARVICQIALWIPGDLSGPRLLERIAGDLVARLAVVTDETEQLVFMISHDAQFARILGLPPGTFLRRFLGVSADAPTVGEEFVTRFATFIATTLMHAVADCANVDVVLRTLDTQHHARLGLPAGVLAARVAALMPSPEGTR